MRRFGCCQLRGHNFVRARLQFAHVPVVEFRCPVTGKLTKPIFMIAIVLLDYRLTSGSSNNARPGAQ